MRSTLTKTTRFTPHFELADSYHLGNRDQAATRLHSRTQFSGIAPFFSQPASSSSRMLRTQQKCAFLPKSLGLWAEASHLPVSPTICATTPGGLLSNDSRRGAN
jgi:hypothetical protein